MEVPCSDSIRVEWERDVNGASCSSTQEGQPPPQQAEEEHDDDEESGFQDNCVATGTNSEVTAEVSVSDSTPGKRGRDENGENGAPTEVHVSKKRKEAKVNSAQPEKGRQQKQQTQQQLQDGGKKKMKDYVFQYGNYHRYYGYRLGKMVDEDPRLKYFKKEWFEGKDCLDVGCNEGFVTIFIAQKYECRSILGLDIDNFLIKKAMSNLKKAAAFEPLNSVPLEVEHLEDNSGERCNESVGNGPGSELDDVRRCSGSASLLQRVKFREEQFIKDFPHGDYKKDGMFDTVLCLSVTKWIHLNWGDSGLIRLFAKIYHILRPGGILILEPQPWKSYLKKNKISEVTRQCFKNIQITPAHFKEVLLDKIGFKSVEEISQAVPNSSLGFDRSLFLYLK
ncbi:unnamed protein product [Calypogeia fissa]